MLKLKVDGKEIEMPKEKVLAQAQRGLAADKRFEEASKLRKEADELLSSAKQKEFVKLAEKAGMSRIEAREALEAALVSLYEEEALSPEQKAQRERDAKLADYEAKEKSRKESEEKEAITKEEQKFMQKIEHELIDALEKSVLPVNPLYGKLASNYLAAGYAQGVELSPSDAVKLVEADQIELVKHVLGSLPIDRLETFVGPKVLKQLREQSVAKVKAAEAPLKPKASPSPASKPTPTPEQPAEKTTVRSKDVFEQMRRNLGVL
jgi:hypothetical protein